MIKIPKRIAPCPIETATVEFRFSTDWNVERLRDAVYSRVKDQYPPFEELPIKRIPQEIIEQEDALRYQPYYQARTSSLVLLLGVRMISVINSAPYLGWKTFQSECLKIWNMVQELGAVQEIERLGLRYVNIFEDIEIFSKTSISPTLHLEFSGFTQKTSYFRTFFRRDTFGCLLQVSNELTEPQHQRNASLIDIDVSLDKEHLQNSIITEALDSAHTIEKELFFGLLQPEFLNTLNPEY